MLRRLILVVLLLNVALFAQIEEGKKAFEKKEYKKAYEVFLKSAQEGMVAKYNLGYLHEFGLGVKKDIKKAISFYTLSANDGYDLAQNTMGNAYLKGVGVEKNLPLAISFYQLAAKQGNKEATNTLKLIQKKIDESKALTDVGYITIRSNVSKDKVYLNNKFVGSTKLTIPIDSNKVHKIKVEKDGYETYYFKEIKLKKDEKKTIKAILKKKK